MLRGILAAAATIAALAGSASAQVLFDNGPYITSAGTGPADLCFNGAGPADISAIEAGLGTFGFNGTAFRLADDFAIPCGITWHPTGAQIVTYQTSATCQTTITGGTCVIYNGDPRVGGTAVFTSSTILPVESLNAYRTVTAGTGYTRQLQRVTFDLTGAPALGSGVYWVSMVLTGSANFSGPWIPPSTPSRTTDNAISSGDNGVTWGALATPGADIPFRILGTSSGTACPPPANPVVVTVPGDGSFGSATGSLNPGAIRWFSFTLGAGIAAGQRLDVHTEGSVLTGGPFPNDTVMAVYKPDGTLAVVDDDDGDGYTSQGTIGTPIGFQSATSSGLNYSGRDGTTLPAGTYYVAVVGYSPTNNFGAGYTVITNHTETGTVSLSVRRVTGIPAITTIRDTVLNAQDMGTITPGTAFVSATGTVAAGTNKWFKFTIAAMTNTDALDITTEGSALAPANNTSIGLYDANGARLGADFNSGSGGLSLMSFGGGFRNRVNTSWNFYGQNNPTGFTNLAAGTYWLAVTGGDEAGYGIANFDVANGKAANTGTVRVNVRQIFNPVNDSSPPAATAFPTLSEGVNSQSTTMAAGDVAWFTFTVPADADLGYTLDIDTEGTNVAPVNDTTLVLYDADGTRPATGRVDADRGSAYLSQLSYGFHYASTVPLAARTDGRDGSLTIGNTYYIGVRLGGGGSTTANWNLNSDSNNAGPVTVRVIYHQFAPALGLPAPSSDLGTLGGVRTRDFNDMPMRPADVIWYQFTLATNLTASGTNWLDIDTADTTVAPRNDTWIGLYAADGSLVANNDDAGANAVVIMSQLSFGSTDATGRPEVIPGARPRNGDNGELVAGTYYLAATMWDATTVFNTANFGVVTNHVQDSANGYFVHFRYNLPGGACNVADVCGIGGPPSPPDGLLTGDDFNAFINAFAASDLLADICGIGGPPSPPDGLITGDDFNAFINAFATGCP